MPISARLLAFACLLTLAGAASAQERALDVSGLQWKMDTARIIVGETTAVPISLTAKKPDGTPLDVAPPRLQVSTGTVSTPIRVGPGAWATTFTPPAEAFPHVAIVFADLETSTSQLVSFLPLRLWGKGQTTVKTKPGSKVTVFIGNDSFGPVEAGDDGAALVPIVVPPGPERAVAKSIDDVGNESQKTIDLGVPLFNRIAMVALDDVASADATGAARLLLFAVDKKGDPLFEARFKSTVSTGELDAQPVGLAPGMFRLGYRPGKAGKGTARIDLALEGSPESKASTTVKILTGRPVRAVLDSKTTTLTADEPRSVQLTVSIFDSANGLLPANAASIDVSVGRIEDMVDEPGGARRINWILPAQLKPGVDKATATVRAPDGTVLGTHDVALLPGAPAKIAFDPIDPVVADGEAKVEVRLRVSDKTGNAIVPTDAVVEVDPSAGQLLAPVVEGRVWKATFVPAVRDHDDFAELRGSAAGLSTTAQVRLVPRPRARLLVGTGIIVATNYTSLVQAGPELSLLVRLPGLDGSAHAGLSVSMLQSVVAAPDLDHRAFPVLLEGAWRPLLGPDLVLHLGAAAGFVVTDELQGDTRTVLPGLAAQAVVGVGRRLGQGFVEAELRGGYGATFPDAAVGAPLGAGAVLVYRFGI